MLVNVKNVDLEIACDSFGAELHSIKLCGHEYLWQCGDAWKRHAPVLFPFICSPADKKYSAKGKDYTMPANHGFARDSEFELVGYDDTSVGFVLSDSDETRAVYPYQFDFVVEYKVKNSKVLVRNIVKNTGDDDMYFYVGGHPAFNCPLEEGQSFDDYYVEFSCNESVVQPTPNGERKILNNESKLALSRELFDYDVIMKENPASTSVTIKSDKSQRFVTVEYPMSNCIAVWSPTGDNNAAFVCLEPWTSVPVYADDEFYAIEEKPHAIKLGAGQQYVYEYYIVVG